MLRMDYRVYGHGELLGLRIVQADKDKDSHSRIQLSPSLTVMTHSKAREMLFHMIKVPPRRSKRNWAISGSDGSEMTPTNERQVIAA